MACRQLPHRMYQLLAAYGPPPRITVAMLQLAVSVFPLHLLTRSRHPRL